MPVSVAVRGRVEMEVESERIPVRVPVWVGAKVIWTVQLEADVRVLPEVGHPPREAA
jgi:hypothetical protein